MVSTHSAPPVAPSARPEIDFSEFGPVSVAPLGRIREITADVLTRNWLTIPHVTHHDELDVTAVEAARRAWNEAHSDARITPVVLMICAAAAALKAFPNFNASLSGNGKSLTLKDYVNIGVAVDTPRGLLVPVIRGCDAKSPSELAAELAETSARARVKGLSMAEMSGGSISISSLGHIGGTAFTPIINAPEVAIIGTTRLVERPARDGSGGLTWKTMLPVSLSYDHRVINGADAARFVSALGDALSSTPLQ